MSPGTGIRTRTGRVPPRVLGRLGTSGRGPSLVVVGGLHGNEPAGVEASVRVLEALDGREGAFLGSIHFLVGNRHALAEGSRFLDRDLNRMWTAEGVASLRDGSGPGPVEALHPEDGEQRELLAEIDAIFGERSGPVYVLDLHTTSGERGVFTSVGDTLENRALALALPVPLVLGLEEQVEGTLQDYLGRRGAVSLLFESGQHSEPSAVDRAEAAVWIVLAATGILPREAVPELPSSMEVLREEGRRLPRSLELRHRHPVTPADGFRMDPGWRNFDSVERGEALGSDRSGPVTASESGRVLMPLYQAQGEDGFFLVREFRPFWLRLSGMLRRAGADRFVHWLPGIREHPARDDALLVDQRIARWYALEVLHLLGFRRYHEEDGRLVVLRRVPPVLDPGRPAEDVPVT